MEKIFTCNFTSELEELLNEGKVDVDYVKFPSINVENRGLERAKKYKSVMFHGLLPNPDALCTEDFLNNFDMISYKKFLKETNTPHTSAHINAYEKDFENVTSMNGKDFKNYLLNNIIKNVIDIKSNINLTFLLENLVYSPQDGVLKCVTDTDFIYTAISETDTKFLFDINHARLSAYFRNMTLNEYMCQLPMERVHEIHLYGLKKDINNKYITPHSHNKMHQEDYEILEFLLKNTSAKYITLEYGPRDSSYDYVNQIYKDELYEQIMRIREILEKY